MVGMLPRGKPAAVETKEIQYDIVSVYIKGKFKNILDFWDRLTKGLTCKSDKWYQALTRDTKAL